ncbi:MAG: hypothetical protein D6780_03055 [Candidatus Dadabacteria bacterium]|nr:MAG: hypothetical protein D6780_03055 [Candidatus Dadabacteria bacterium]
MSDEEARKNEIPFVRGLTIENDDFGQAYYNRMEEIYYDSSVDPFYQVNADWYNIAVMTGGIWAPLRETPNNCSPSQPTCSANCDPATDCPRQTTDPQCRSITDQVRDYIKEALKASNTFVIVSSS